jgi:hypothetical protein
MTTTQAIFFGIMVALAPSVLLTLVLWRDESGPGEENKPALQHRYSSPDLELVDQPLYPNP